MKTFKERIAGKIGNVEDCAEREILMALLHELDLMQTEIDQLKQSVARVRTVTNYWEPLG